MVFSLTLANTLRMRVSVLALSSRFDGLVVHVVLLLVGWCFSTRSVESF